MSVKRQATSELNHTNWDDEDPSDDKTMGEFKAAPKEVLEKRVIRTAKRRNPISIESSKSVFSGFGGFNKTQKPSFDFLANLTNGSNNTNGSTSTTGSVTTTTTSSLFSNKLATNSEGLFGAQSSSSALKPSQSMTWTSPFGSSAKTSPSSLFSAKIADSASKETSFNIAQISSSSSLGSAKLTTQNTTSVFGVASTSANDSKAPTNSSPFKIQSASSTTTATVQTSCTVTTPDVTTITPEKISDENGKPNENKIKYFSKLKGLNEAVSDWISKHVAQTPLCILSPIFNDYEKYLKEIAEEYHRNKQKSDGNVDEKTDNGASTKTSTLFGINNTGSSTFASKDTKTSSPFGTNTSASSNQDIKISAPFAFNNISSSPLKTQDTKSTTFDSKSGGLFTFAKTSKHDTTTSTFFVAKYTEPILEDIKTTANGIIVSYPTKSDDTKVSVSFGITPSKPINSSSSNQDTKISSSFATKNTGSSVFTSSATNSEQKLSSPFAPLNNSTDKPSIFGSQTKLQASPENKQPTFSFGIKSPTDSSAPKSNSGFSFGIITTATSSAFPMATTSTTQSMTAPFSFGTGKPFSFSANTVQQQSGDTKNEETTENEEEEPPKVEYTPVQEENCVYEKKCKIFTKRDGNFVDNGVGTLYIKKIEGNVKHQLLVRANTSLGTVLLNLVLANAIPTQRMGKNNVMMVCIPTPDAKPPPTPILIRVKTGEEADELLETLNKYKA